MEDDIKKELEELREENKILRDSLVDIQTEDPKDGESAVEGLFRQIGGLLGTTAGLAKEYLRPGAEKVTEALGQKMGENPVPILLAAFGAGYLTGRRLNRK